MNPVVPSYLVPLKAFPWCNSCQVVLLVAIILLLKCIPKRKKKPSGKISFLDNILMLRLTTLQWLQSFGEKTITFVICSGIYVNISDDCELGDYIDGLLFNFPKKLQC